MRMSWGANILDFFYDESGLPYAMKYNGTVYYYLSRWGVIDGYAITWDFNPGDKFYDSETRYFAVGKS